MRLWDDSTPWLVTGYENQKRLLADPRCTVDPTKSGYPYTNPAFKKAASHGGPSVLPEHGRPRTRTAAPHGGRLVHHQRIEPLRLAVQRMTGDLIDTMLAGPKPADLVRSLALPLPSLVICELLGVPYEGHDFLPDAERSSRGSTRPVSSPAAKRRHWDCCWEPGTKRPPT
ncbi:hypothetical protein [Streptomyces sioyaensis]|uniref:hypothetical protein n=1 Tax=Streptomyces sioyaensis TaxID=67364 RepID=UPI003D7320F0